MDSIIQLVQKSTPLPISYAQHLIPKDRKFFMSSAERHWKSMLQDALDQADLSFRIIGSNVIIHPKEKFSFQGFVYDAQSGESLPGAHLTEALHGSGTISNNEGYFQLTLPKGLNQITISYLGYQPLKLSWNANQPTRKDIRLEPSLDLPQVIVDESSNDDHNHLISVTIEEEIPLGKLNGFPALGSAMDVSRYLQFIPGVSSGSDGFGGIHVRGGSSDQNLFLLDGIPVYNPFHMLGASSIFNAAALQQVSLSKNYFHAGQGDRLSSVLDIRMRDGHREKTTISAGISALSSHAVLETPLLKKKGTFMIASQISHAGSLIKHYSSRLKESRDLQGYFRPKFNDIYAKAFLELNKNNKLIVNFYQGNDIFTETEAYEFVVDTTYTSHSRDQYRWGNSLAGLRWLHAFKSNIFAKISAHSSTYHYQSLNATLWTEEIGSFLNSETDLTEFQSRISEKGLKTELDILLGIDHNINVGIALTSYDYTPGIIAYDGRGVIPSEIFFNDTEITPLDEGLFDALHFNSWQLSSFAQDYWSINEKWSLNYGFHATLFANGPSQYLSFQPRVRLSRSWGNLGLDLSYASMQQANHLITTEDNGLPNELWVPSTSQIAPATANSFDLKFSLQTGTRARWQSSLYYKEMKDILSFRDDPSFLSFGKLDNVDASTWETDIAVGKGKSWGIENSWEWQSIDHYLKANYTYAKSTRQFMGKYLDFEYPYPFERPHEFTMLTKWPITNKIELACSWQWGSGVAIPLVEGQFDIIDNEQFLQETITIAENEIELLIMPAYHRLDISASYEIRKKEINHIFKISLLNTYNQANITFPKVNYDSMGGIISFRSGLPFIPSLSYQISM